MPVMADFFSRTAEFQRLVDDRREILLPSVPSAIWTSPGILDDCSGENAVSIVGFRRHQAVGGEQEGRRDILEFLLLVLPGCAEIALELRILLQFGITVGRQHFAVGVDVDALAFGLFEQHVSGRAGHGRKRR